jgi:hypothetical protein
MKPLRGLTLIRPGNINAGGVPPLLETKTIKIMNAGGVPPKYLVRQNFPSLKNYTPDHILKFLIFAILII